MPSALNKFTVSNLENGFNSKFMGNLVLWA